MTDQFEDFKAKAPTLVFDAAPKEEAKTPAPEPEKKEILNDSMLTQEERQQVDAFAEQIDLRNSGAVLHYGVGTQKKLADFSERALNNVRTKDMGEVGNMIASLVTELRSLDDSTVTVLENHQIQLMKDIDVLDRMYEMNLMYFKELTMYILAGKKKLQQVRTTELPALQQKAQSSGLPEDAQAARDLADLCERFEKKLYDLELTRTVSVQTAPQIRMVQNADTLMAEKIQSTIVNTIPLWKSQMVIAIGVEHSAQAARAQREVTDMTNALLRKNADALKMATIESAKESERGIVDLETLKHTNETLITTLDEVMKIQSEGREKRRAAEAELTDMENQLKHKMLEISRM